MHRAEFPDAVHLKTDNTWVLVTAADSGSNDLSKTDQASASLRPRHVSKTKLAMASSNGATPQEESRALQHTHGEGVVRWSVQIRQGNNETEVGGTWVDYNDEMNMRLEAAYRSATSTHVVLSYAGGPEYTIWFEMMLQVHVAAFSARPVRRSIVTNGPGISNEASKVLPQVAEIM